MNYGSNLLENVKSGQSAVLKLRQAEWRIQWLNDGYDYPALLDKFRRGELKGRSLSTGSNFREVYCLEYDGRKFVVKRDWEIDRRPEKAIWDLIGGTPYHRLIKFTTRAALKGSTIAQGVYLVAEKMSRGRCREAWLVAEYVEGESLIQEFKDGRPAKVVDNLGEYISAMNETLEKLHDGGLASNDVHPGQFIVTDQGLRVIDLSLDGPMIVCQVNDALTMMHFFNFRPPLRNPWRRAFYELFALRRRFKNFYRSLRSATVDKH